MVACRGRGQFRYVKPCPAPYSENPEFSETFWDFGSGGRDRTYDQVINSHLLYR